MIFEKEELIDLCSYYLPNLVTKLTLLTVQYVCSQRIPPTSSQILMVAKGRTDETDFNDG